MADRLGAIRPGMAADLVAIDVDRAHLTPLIEPAGTLVHVAQGRDVRMVVVDGVVVAEDGQLAQIDGQTVMREAQEAANSLWDRVRATTLADAPTPGPSEI